MTLGLRRIELLKSAWTGAGSISRRFWGLPIEIEGRRE
jgi:hypothetical protein